MCLKVIDIVKEDVLDVKEGIIVEESFFGRGGTSTKPVVQKALEEYGQKALKKLTAKTPSVQKEGAQMLKELSPWERYNRPPTREEMNEIHSRMRQADALLFPNRANPANIGRTIYQDIRPALPQNVQQHADNTLGWLATLASTAMAYIRYQNRNNHRNL